MLTSFVDMVWNILQYMQTPPRRRAFERCFWSAHRTTMYLQDFARIEGAIEVRACFLRPQQENNAIKLLPFSSESFAEKYDLQDPTPFHQQSRCGKYKALNGAKLVKTLSLSSCVLSLCGLLRRTQMLPHDLPEWTVRVVTSDD